MNKTIIKYTLFKTVSGWMGISASHQGIVMITLPEPSPDEALKKLQINTAETTRDDTFFQETINNFKQYYSGEIVIFHELIDHSGASDFQKSVWETARQIPYGQTRSYQWIAENIGNPKSARAVGNALGKNKCPVIIPCHRVISSDGSLGGFSGGIEIKKKLLQLESGN